MTDEAPGTNCPAGGVRIQVGLDNGEGGGAARNGNLEVGEIDRTSYLCNGLKHGTLIVSTLTANNCTIGADHPGTTGDDRGGIAWSPNYLHYNGDSSVGRFNISGLGSPTAYGIVYDGITSDLDTGNLYALAAGATTNWAFSGAGVTLDRLVRLNPATGAVEATTMLSQSVAVPNYSGTPAQHGGMYSGPGFMLLVNTTNVYRIYYASGAVTNMGARPSTLDPMICENWANWGVAEFNGTQYAMVYRSSNWSAQSIVRTTLSNVTTTVATFTNLSDMCSFTVNPNTNRWYFHWEGGSQWGGTDEGIGYCDATMTTP
jgi:hypothetical protein